ncbi:MFS transporter [Nocardia sp. NPDC049526]|uniref:MFS transporter n=1 Tax=Nocardia sp. NPDC049526 TaxID=3364316 RepID=UPI0037966BAB
MSAASRSGFDEGGGRVTDEPEVDALATVGQAAGRGQVVAWGLWDWGSSAFNAVILTFVFSVYLTDKVGDDLPGGVSPSAWLGWALGIAGFVVALTAPISGQRFDANAKRKRSLGVLTALTILTMTLMFFVHDDYHHFWFGLVLLGFGSAFIELAGVPYNAMLRQVSTPADVGRVSGFGWAMGYFGGIFILLISYFGFISGHGDNRGLLGVPIDDGTNIRLVAMLAAVWFAAFALPVLFAVPELPPTSADPGAAKAGFFGSYRVLWRDLRELWAVDRRTVGFLIASAIFRDGLAGVFTFGAILAVRVYGIADSDVLLFGIAANVVAALGAVTAGRFDDRLGPKIVIVISLVAMVICGTALLIVSGPVMFWIFGLLLTIFVGPAQSAARSFLTRLAPPGREGQMFGLYTTTGRAVSFLAPVLFGFFVWAFDADRAGIVGILVVLAVGLVALLPVRKPDRAVEPAE